MNVNIFKALKYRFNLKEIKIILKKAPPFVIFRKSRKKEKMLYFKRIHSVLAMLNIKISEEIKAMIMFLAD